jgi:hypothetical protein
VPSSIWSHVSAFRSPAIPACSDDTATGQCGRRDESPYPRLRAPTDHQGIRQPGSRRRQVPTLRQAVGVVLHGRFGQQGLSVLLRYLRQVSSLLRTMMAVSRIQACRRSYESRLGRCCGSNQIVLCLTLQCNLHRDVQKDARFRQDRYVSPFLGGPRCDMQARVHLKGTLASSWYRTWPSRALAD